MTAITAAPDPVTRPPTLLDERTMPHRECSRVLRGRAVPPISRRPSEHRTRDQNDGRNYVELTRFGGHLILA